MYKGEKGMYDLHCHILWAMDDGPQRMEQSLNMAKMAVDEGIAAVAATPHFMVGVARFDIKDVQRRIKEFELELAQRDINLDIVPGAEVYLDRRLPDILEGNRLTIAGTRYLLLELPIYELPDYTMDVIKALVYKGVIPIIAHPERNPSILKKPNLLFSMVKEGALGQLTAGSIIGRFGSKIQKMSWTLLSHNLAHILAGDAHCDTMRRFHMAQAARVIEETMGSGVSFTMTHKVPRMILSDTPRIKVEPPVAYRPKRRVFDFFPWKKNQ